MITTCSLTKRYGSGEGRAEVLKGIDIEIEDGSFTAILGASGSGKSTLLNIISGLERPDGGNVMYGEKDITVLTDSELTKLRKENVGLVFQQYYLLPDMTVEKNVRMGADLADNTEFSAIIAAVGLESKAKKYPSELSGGEMQRVAIARALAKRPKVLFADEPTGALDETTGRQVLDYIAKLQREFGLTVLMVTHNRNIADMADSVIELYERACKRYFCRNDTFNRTHNCIYVPSDVAFERSKRQRRNDRPDARPRLQFCSMPSSSTRGIQAARIHRFCYRNGLSVRTFKACRHHDIFRRCRYARIQFQPARLTDRACRVHSFI